MSNLSAAAAPTSGQNRTLISALQEDSISDVGIHV